ncbi:aldose 1-epimerase [Polaribacter sp. P097]|uniref:aldose 1-epimerase n=1 Tax=Polaribacter sp. P097 TaxID=3117398 RepID=UPI002FE41CE5
MFKINVLKEKENTVVELSNKDKTAIAKIGLNEGARLVDLTLNNKTVIEEQTNFDYKNSYASAVLFPFAGRIENGAYQFKFDDYQLDCNDKNNAIHGLVYNKTFEIFEPEEHQDNCSVTFNYYEKNPVDGFPFTYFLSVTYTLFESHLNTRVTIKNIDDKAFPFTLGWHPYFKVTNFQESFLALSCYKKAVFNENMVAEKLADYNFDGEIALKDARLDDCFILKHNKAILKTPDYHLKITSDASKNYYQVFTPKKLPLIAIEPLTGVANNFNNNIGLQVLEPEATYVQNWDLELVD